MADLIAQGPDRPQRWRRRLPSDELVYLGRDADTWAVPWDNRISRRHAKLTWRGVALEVEAIPDRPNPIFFRGQSSTRFSLRAGEHFVIGSTTFTLVEDAINVTIDVPRPATQQTFSPDYLRQVAFRHARQQIDALSRLPEIVAGAVTDQELCMRLVNLLLTGITSAKAVAVVRVETKADVIQRVEVLHWDRAEVSNVSFQPSGHLIREAFREQQGVIHLWHRSDPPSPYTMHEEFDWAFCIPVPGVSCSDWAIYVAGDASETERMRLTPDDFQDSLKFVELVATTVGSVCDVRLLQRRTTTLSHFLSPPVRDALAASDPEVALAPREADVTVLFCDLRGFSRESERAADDLFGLLERVSGSLGIMTGRILEHGGVIGDFHGDAAMGFWGWPLPQTDSVVRACLAALEIRSAFEVAALHDQHAMSGFRVGMGLATGRAVAGKIGTIDQVKVTVFGPVVNIAARLEGMTRQFGSAILIDAATAAIARTRITTDVAQVRRLAEFRPYGMQSTVEVYQLMPVGGDLRTSSSDLATHEAAVTAFRAGNWRLAHELFHRLPSHDPARQYFIRFIEARSFVVPPAWDGVIPLSTK